MRILPCYYTEVTGGIFSTTPPGRGGGVKVTAMFVHTLSGLWCVYYHAIRQKLPGDVFNKFVSSESKVTAMFVQ